MNAVLTTNQFEKVALSDCCEIISGSTPSRNKAEYWSGDINWFTPKDLSRIKSKYISEAPEKITALGLKSCSTTLLPKNSLLLSSRAPIGHIAITTIEACTNQGFKSLVPNKNLDVEYLYYAIKNIIPQLKDMGNGATFKEISKSTLSKVQIPLPPLAEQKQIAAILDKADSLRQKDQQLVEHYTALSQSLFLEMFGDLSEYSNSPLKEVSDFIDYRGKTPIKTPSGIPLITAKNVKNGYISTEPEEFISENDYLGWMRRGFPNEGDVLFTTEAPLGQAALMPKYQKVALAQRVICLQPHSELNSSFLMHVIFSSFFKNQLFNFATGSTVKGVRSKELAKIKIPLPSINLQNQFAERIAIIEQQKQQAQTNLQKSEALFNSLLQRAFTGELTADKAA